MPKEREVFFKDSYDGMQFSALPKWKDEQCIVVGVQPKANELPVDILSTATYEFIHSEVDEVGRWILNDMAAQLKQKGYEITRNTDTGNYAGIQDGEGVVEFEIHNVDFLERLEGDLPAVFQQSTQKREHMTNSYYNLDNVGRERE